MDNMFNVLLLILVFVSSCFLTYLVRNYNLKHQIIDIPNNRSSHTVPTPRGGGLAFVAVFAVGVSALFGLGILELKVFLALVGGGCLIAGLGWIDDKRGLSALVRLCFHFLVAIWAVVCLEGLPNLSLGFTELNLSWWGSIVAVIGVVWMINLYNFMDGIDGIASIEAITVSGVAAIFLWSQASNLVTVCLVLAASVLGFLVWNWPPAKIFMGDVGSGFLGFIFAVLALWSENAGAVPLIIWLLLLGVFVIDATATLIRRMSMGEKIYEAHRSHVYQLAVQVGYSHKQVTLAVLLINIILGIIAAFALNHYHYLGVMASAALIMLIIAHLLMGRVFNARISQVSSSGGNTLIKQSVVEAAAAMDVVDPTTE